MADKVSSLKNIAGSGASGNTICEILDSMSGMGDKVSAANAMLPNAKEIILASSTADSTKRFKITVVDNGTISATEIVEASTLSDDDDDDTEVEGDDTEDVGGGT